jgi:L-fucose isomerase-like protein
MGVVFDRFIRDNDLDGIAVLCWTEMQKYQIGGAVGVMPCTCMSMLSDKLLPAACETDIAGWIGMYMLQSASGLVPLLGDWNNMFDDAVRDALPYINAQAGTNQSGRALLEYYEHSTVEEVWRANA